MKTKFYQWQHSENDRQWKEITESTSFLEVMIRIFTTKFWGQIQFGLNLDRKRNGTLVQLSKLRILLNYLIGVIIEIIQPMFNEN